MNPEEWTPPRLLDGWRLRNVAIYREINNTKISSRQFHLLLLKTTHKKNNKLRRLYNK